MALAVANRYARALADIAFAPGSGLDAAAALTQLRAFAQLPRDYADLKNVLLSPAVGAARKHAVVAKLGEPLGLHRLVKNFLFVLVDHRRVAMLDEIVAAFEAAVDERTGRVRAQVSSASALPVTEQLLLEQQLGTMTGKKVRCDFEVDPDLLGGVSVRVGSTIYDGSVRGRLNALKRRLSAE